MNIQEVLRPPRKQRTHQARRRGDVGCPSVRRLYSELAKQERQSPERAQVGGVCRGWTVVGGLCPNGWPFGGLPCRLQPDYITRS